MSEENRKIAEDLALRLTNLLKGQVDPSIVAICEAVIDEAERRGASFIRDMVLERAIKEVEWLRQLPLEGPKDGKE